MQLEKCEMLLKRMKTVSWEKGVTITLHSPPPSSRCGNTVSRPLTRSPTHIPPIPSYKSCMCSVQYITRLRLCTG